MPKKDEDSEENEEESESEEEKSSIRDKIYDYDINKFSEEGHF